MERVIRYKIEDFVYIFVTIRVVFRISAESSIHLMSSSHLINEPSRA